MLRLRAGEFDPLRDPLPIPDGLALGELGELQIVQFDGIIQTSWRSVLENFGQVLAYLPDNSYIFRSDPKNADIVRTLPHVRYVGNFEPGYKLDPALPLTSDMVPMQVVYFRDLDWQRVAADIASLGAKIVAVDPILIRIEAPGALAERIAFLPSVMWVAQYHPPVIDNGNSARILKARAPTDGGYDWSTSNHLWSFNATSQKYEGYAGENYTAAVFDTGVDGTHPAFTGKKVGYYGYGTTAWTDGGGHGTHTAGTVLGHGDWRASNPGPMGQYAGMAPLAGLVGQNMDGPQALTYYNATNDAIKFGAIVSSNSWGATMGAYTPDDYSYDILVRDSDSDAAGNQSISCVFSAGNTGSNPGTVCSPSSAKNVISVGALDDSSGTSVAGFSARGLTVDSRVKPDVMAPGVSVTSCSLGGTSYVGMSGTSMSCPAVSGCVVLVNEYCNETRGALPSPALVRNLLVNGADTIPGYSFAGKDVGWGRVNMGRSLLNSTARKIWYEDQKYTISTGESKIYSFCVTSAAELKVSITWTDEAGALYANPALVNNLDLTVTAPDGTIYRGNNFASGYSVSGGQNDTRNNTEMVRLASPATGKWFATVRGFNVPIVAQDYALVIAGPISNVVREIMDTAAIELASSSGDPAEGENLLFTGNIANVGTLPVPNQTYQFRLKCPNNATVILGQAEVPPLSVGAKLGVQTSWRAVRGNYTIYLDADPNRTVFEDSEDNNTISAQFRVRGYGLGVSCDSPSARTDPAKQVALSCNVNNSGNVQDNVLLSIPSGIPPGWNVTLDPENIALGAGQAAGFRALVTPPANASAYDRLDFQVPTSCSGSLSLPATRASP
jgi:subtilisin family serine protease